MHAWSWSLLEIVIVIVFVLGSLAMVFAFAKHVQARRSLHRVEMYELGAEVHEEIVNLIAAQNPEMARAGSITPRASSFWIRDGLRWRRKDRIDLIFDFRGDQSAMDDLIESIVGHFIRDFVKEHPNICICLHSNLFPAEGDDDMAEEPYSPFFSQRIG